MTDSYFDPDVMQGLESSQDEYDEQQRQEEAASQLDPSAEGKQGPTYVEGASAKAEEDLAWAKRNPERTLFNTGIGGYETPFAGFEGLYKATKPVSQGLVDTGVGALNLVAQGNLGTGDLQDQWHKMHPTGQNPIADLTRQVSGLAIPSLILGGAGVTQLSKLPIATKLNSVQKFLAGVAARMGVDTGILASSTSATDDNMAKTFGDTFGVYAPWANKEGDSADVRFKLNLFENIGFLGGIEIIGGIFQARTAIKNAIAGADYFTPASKITAELPAKTAVRWDSSAVVIPQSDEAVEVLVRNADDLAEQSKHPEIRAIDEEIEKFDLDLLTSDQEARLAELTELRRRIQVDIDDMDPVTASAMKSRHARNNTLREEALEVLAENPEEFNPIAHDPAMAQQRAVTNVDGDVVGAVLDHDRIINQINVDNGRARAALPTKGMRDLLKANRGERGERLAELGAKIPKQVEAIYENKWKRSAADLEKTVNKLVNNIYHMNTDEMAAALNQMKTNIQEGYKAKFLDDESFVAVSQAFRRVFNDMYNPKAVQASVIAVQQAGDAAKDAAHASVVMDGMLDTRRLMDNALTNMELVNQEIRANRFLWGYQGRMLDMAKNPNPRVAEKLREMISDFDMELANAKESGKKVINSLKEINEKDPNYLKAFKLAYDRTDGKVDELFKLHRWAENNIGLIKKGFIDWEPEVPSLVIQGIHGIRYNGYLNGRAPLRASLGGGILLLGKPISAFAGAGVRGRFGDFRRALATYGGWVENFRRATKHMAAEWNYVRQNPELAMARGRADIKFSQSDSFEAMEAMAEAWRAEGKTGKVAMLQSAKLMSWYNNHQLFRWGVNGLYAIDGFTNSMVASGTARAKAYAELMDQTSGQWSDSMFLARSQQLYDNSFDATGLLTDEAAKLASQEVALNLDNKVVRGLDHMIDFVPALKPLFMFNRTGINGLQMAWSYTPTSALGLALGKARSVFKAVTKSEKIAAMAEHGFKASDYSDIAFETLKNEYRGRQVMGGAVTMAAGLWAAQGNLTGPGPKDAKERRDMEALGTKWFSIKNPFTGKWHSYQGLEPYDKILALAGQIAYESDRVDSTIAEDWYLKLAWGLSANVTNSTFLSGLQPLVALLGNDETAWARFVADGHINPTVPFAHAGLRSMLNDAITSQLKDVENDIGSYLLNRNKFLFSENHVLKDQIDVYTGDRINYVNPITSAINSVMPVFKQNGGLEPWRQWLIGTGWDGLHEMRSNPDIPGSKLTPEERYYINTWVAQNAGLKEQIEELMAWDQLNEKGSMADYRKNNRSLGQERFPVTQTRVHKELTRMHNEAFRLAWAQLRIERKSTRPLGLLEEHKRDLMNQGRYEEASDLQPQIDDLLRLQKPLN